MERRERDRQREIEMRERECESVELEETNRQTRDRAVFRLTLFKLTL